MVREYKINLSEMRDLLKTKYAPTLEFDANLASHRAIESSITPDNERYVHILSVLNYVLDRASSGYKPFPHSSLGIDSNMVATIPVTEGNKKVRFGTTMFDLDESIFSIDTGRATSQSVVVMDYSKYLERIMSKDEKFDLSFLVNILRTGRSPLLEVMIAQEMEGIDADTLLDNLYGRRANDHSEDIINSHLAQVSNISRLIEDTSPLRKNPSLSKSTAKDSMIRVAPLITILLDYLNMAQVNLVQTKIGIIDKTKYSQWMEDTFDTISPENISRELTTNVLSSLVYILQYMAHDYSILNYLTDSGFLKTYIDDVEDSSASYELPQAKNSKLMTTMAVMAAGHSDGMMIEGALYDSDYSDLMRRDLSHRHSLGFLDEADSESFIHDIIADLNSNSTDPLTKDIRRSFNTANTTIIPVNDVLSDKNSGSPYTDAMYPGLYLSKHINKNHTLGEHARGLAKVEEEDIRGSDSYYSRSINSSNRHWKKNSPTNILEINIRSVGVASISDTGFARQSTLKYAEETYQGSNERAYGWGNPSGSIHSEYEGKDTGAVRFIDRVTMITTPDNGGLESYADMAYTMDSRSQGKWYKINLDLVRSSKLALDRVLGRLAKELK